MKKNRQSLITPKTFPIKKTIFRTPNIHYVNKLCAERIQNINFALYLENTRNSTITWDNNNGLNYSSS